VRHRATRRTPSTLATVIAAIVSLSALAALATTTALDAFHFMPGLNLDQPIVTRGVPPPIESLRPLSRRVILVMVDGLRLDESHGRVFMDGLRARGIDGQAVSFYPTLSNPNYVAIATGVEPRISGVRNNRFLKPVALDSMLARAHEAGRGTVYVSDFTHGVGQLFPGSLDEAAVTPWPGALERGIRHALDDRAALVWIHPGMADGMGHAFGAASPEYDAAVEDIDAMLRRSLVELDWSQDTVILTSDHGHVDGGGHGGLEPEVVNVPLLMAGAGIRPGVPPRNAGLIDLAPTICRLLGLPAPAHAFGRTLTESLTLTEAEIRLTETTDSIRSVLLRGRLAIALGAREQQGLVTRWLRIGTGVATVVILFACIYWLRRRGIIGLDRRVVIFALLPFPLLFYGIFGVVRPFVSPSVLPETGEIESTAFVLGGLAALVNLAAMWAAVAFRPVPRDRLGAAVGVVMLGLSVAILPAAFAWVVVSPPFRYTLPGPSLLLLPPIADAGVACYAAAACIVLIVELTIFFARITHDPPPAPAPG
jgi:hypothetical protein